MVSIEILSIETVMQGREPRRVWACGKADLLVSKILGHGLEINVVLRQKEFDKLHTREAISELRKEITELRRELEQSRGPRRSW